MLAPLPHDEEARLRELSRCGVVDTPPEPVFERATRLAAHIFKVPIALVSFVDRERQWFKSHYGLECSETARGHSFCTYSILGTGTFVVPDARLDERFAHLPLVIGAPFVRSYAGAPLTTARGYRLGTLCIIDTEPRQFSAQEIAMLEDLAAMVVEELELRLDTSRNRREIERHRRDDESLRATRDELEARVEERTAALADAEARYRSLFENAVNGIYQTLPDANGILNVNTAFAALLGYPSPEALIASLRNPDAVYVQPGRRAEVRARLEADGIVTGMESEILRADGSRIWISESARAIRAADGRLLRYEGTFEDITARRAAAAALQRAHEELEDRVHERTAELALFNGTLRQQIADRERAEDNARRSETKFRALIENAQDLTSIVAPEGVMLYISPSVEHILGYPPDDVIGRNIFADTIHPDDRDALRAQFEHTVASGAQYVRSEARYHHRDGTWRLLESIASCAPQDFPIVSLVINSRDITDRRRSEREREAQVHLQTAVAELSRFALQGPELPAIFDLAAGLIARALDVSFSVIAELLPRGELLAIRAGLGWQENVAGRTVTNWRALTPEGNWANPEPLIIEDLRRMPNYVALAAASRGEPVSAVSVVVHSGGRPFGTLTALSDEPRAFSPQDVIFLQTVADLLSTLIEGKRQEIVSREAQARYQRIVANVPGAVYQYGLRPDGTAFLPFISEGCRQLYGVDAETLCANPTMRCDAVHPDDRPGYDAATALSAATLRPFEWEGRIRTPASEIRSIAIRSRPELQANGDIIWDGLVLDVSELKRAQETMREAKEEAEKANRAKSEFLSRMSHELRTPLNAILGFSQLLSLDQLAPVQASSVDQILKAGRHLLDLINEVLDIARIEAGAMEMATERVDAGDALAEAALFTRPLAQQRGVTFLPRVPANGPLAVTADRGRLKQVLLNLFSNAVKYNREGGEVRYACETVADGARVRLSVTDTGPGLEKEEVARLFTPFQRLNAPHRGIPGTGIGLAIAKSLVEAMDGTVGVESTPGEGSTFFVDLPVSAAPAPTTPEVPPAHELLAPTLPAGRTILHIDDQPANLALVERVLESRSELLLLSASGGRAGLALARENRPDVILLDLHLPDMPGEEIVRRLHNEPRTRRIPIIILSADSTPAQIARLRELGVYEYITKPFKIQTLLRTLDAALQPVPPPDANGRPPIPPP